MIIKFKVIPDRYVIIPDLSISVVTPNPLVLAAFWVGPVPIFLLKSSVYANTAPLPIADPTCWALTPILLDPSVNPNVFPLPFTLWLSPTGILALVKLGTLFLLSWLLVI